MKNIRTIALGVIVLGVIVIAAALYYPNRPVAKPTPTPSASADLSHIRVTEKIDFAGLKSNEIATVEATPSATVLDVLNQSKQITLKHYSFGDQVTGIEGVDGTAQKMYWMYSVNGKEAQVGASQYTLHDGDTIDWQLSKS